MVVAVVAVGVVQVIADQVVGVIAVRHGRMATAGPVLVAGLVPGARVAGRAARRVRGIDRDRAFVDMVAVRVVEVTVVQVVDVAVMAYRAVPAVLTVPVVVRLVGLMRAHRLSPR